MNTVVAYMVILLLWLKHGQDRCLPSTHTDTGDNACVQKMRKLVGRLYQVHLQMCYYFQVILARFVVQSYVHLFFYRVVTSLSRTGPSHCRVTTEWSLKIFLNLFAGNLWQPWFKVFWCFYSAKVSLRFCGVRSRRWAHIADTNYSWCQNRKLSGHSARWFCSTLKDRDALIWPVPLFSFTY